MIRFLLIMLTVVSPAILFAQTHQQMKKHYPVYFNEISGSRNIDGLKHNDTKLYHSIKDSLWIYDTIIFYDRFKNIEGKFIRELDTEARISSEKMQGFDGSNFLDYITISYHFNSENRIDEISVYSESGIEKYVYGYHPNGKLKEAYYGVYDSSLTWVAMNKWDFIYSPDWLQTQLRYYYIENGNLLLTAYLNNDYDSRGHFVYEDLYYYMSGNYYPDYRKFFAFDADSNLLMESHEFGYVDGSWGKVYLIINEYKKQGRLDRQFVYFSMNSPDWELNYKDEYIYVDTVLTEINSYFWENNTWGELGNKITYFYDHHLNIKYIYSSNAQNNFEPHYRTVIIFDDDGNPINTTKYVRNFMGWHLDEYQLYEFDENHNSIYGEFENPDLDEYYTKMKIYSNNNNYFDEFLPLYSENSSFACHMFKAHFSLVPSKPNPKFDESKSQIKNIYKIFPNPTNDKVTIIYPFVLQNAEIELFNSNGSLVYKSTFNGYNMIVDLSSYANGIYFLTIRTPEFFETKKLVKN